MHWGDKCLALIPIFGALFVLQSRAANLEAYAYSVSGVAEFAPPHSVSFSPLHVGQKLETGSSVRTGSDGKVCLKTTPGSALEIGNDSLVRINDLAFSTSASGAVTERKARVELTSGVVSALIDPSTPQVTDFQIQTPQGVAAARGTFYAVMVRNGKTFVTADEGKVAAVPARAPGSL
jgi:hypothetical protein